MNPNEWVGAGIDIAMQATNLYQFVLNDPINFIDPTGLIRQGQVLGHGTSNPHVATLQRELVRRGYLTMPAGVVFGFYGDLTQAAVMDFQRSNNLRVTGMVGDITWGALGLDFSVDEFWIRPMGGNGRVISAWIQVPATAGILLAPYAAYKIAKLTTAAGAAGAGVAAAPVVNNLIKNADRLNRTATVMKNIATRPYIKSTQLIQQIMSVAAPIADPGTATGLKWVVEGTWFNAATKVYTTGVFELVINPDTNTILHFLFKSN